MITLFGCWHKKLSFPITKRKRKRGEATFPVGTYVVCLDCGKEFAYDWDRMKLIQEENGLKKLIIKLMEW